MNSNSNSAQQVARRGRPRIHQNDSARTKAYRRRRRKQRHEEDRAFNELWRETELWSLGVQGRLDDELEAKIRALTPEQAEEWMDRLSAERSMREYDWQLQEQRRLPSSLAENSRFIMRSAPQGCGELETGDYDSHKIELIDGLRATEDGRVGEPSDSVVARFAESDEESGVPSVVNRPTCHCGVAASEVHPEDTGKRLSEVRFLCSEHRIS